MCHEAVNFDRLLSGYNMPIIYPDDMLLIHYNWEMIELCGHHNKGEKCNTILKEKLFL